MEKALDPLGRELTAEEYDLIYGKWYKEDGNFPICKVCDQPLFIVARANPEIDTHYRHRDDAECPSTMGDRLSRSIQPRAWEPERGKRILEEFCQIDNLTRTYNTLINIATRLSADEFYLICKEAHRRRIWRYTGITLQSLPYIMAVMRDITCIKKDKYRASSEEGVYRVRVTLRRPRNTALESVWENPGSCFLDRHFVNQDGSIKRMDIGPILISAARFEHDEQSDTKWINRNPALTGKIRKFCIEQGYCHD